MSALAELNINAATRTAFTLSLSHLTAQRAAFEWDVRNQYRDGLDEYYAISGDDLAQLTRGPL